MAESALSTLAALARDVDRRVRGEIPSASQLKVEAEDVQGLALRGYGALREGCYPLLHIDDAVRARAWLGSLVPRIAPGQPAAQGTAVQIAFTPAGLAALGLRADELQGFSREFLAGITGPHKSRFLGDVDESAPEHWQWGGPNNPEVHAVLVLLAEDTPRLEQLHHELRAGWSTGGCSEVRTLPTSSLGSNEHFGFADGISQPAIEGYHSGSSKQHRIKPGEFLLGYPNEYGLYTERPLVDSARDRFARLPLDPEGTPRRDFGRNGTYLVFRQLRQNVPAFRQTLDALTKNSDGSSNEPAQARLAAQMIGRWPSGTSLIEAPYADDASKASSNEFRYHHEDPHGLKCPIGAHVRRANPRDALEPRPGTESSLEVNRRHRLIRRGRVYGAPLAPGATDTEDRGLMFVVLNANITRQFEFVQHSWLVDPRFNGMYDEADPIVGARADNHFAAPGDPVRRRCTGLPRFVTVAGGAYFFMPGVAALRFLSELSS